MVLVQLLLPTVLPKGAAVDGATAALVARRELAETLDRVTAYFRSPAKNTWTPDGHAEQDDVVMVEVVTERFDRHWWRPYFTTLLERLQQDAIHRRAHPIQALDEAGEA